MLNSHMRWTLYAPGVDGRDICRSAGKSRRSEAKMALGAVQVWPVADLACCAVVSPMQKRFLMVEPDPDVIVPGKSIV